VYLSIKIAFWPPEKRVQVAVSGLRAEEKVRASAAEDRGEYLPFSVLPTFRLAIYSSAAFWKANLTGESSALLKLDRWIIRINATPLFMSIQA
jgi:hypothetical protein